MKGWYSNLLIKMSQNEYVFGIFFFFFFSSSSSSSSSSLRVLHIAHVGLKP